MSNQHHCGSSEKKMLDPVCGMQVDADSPHTLDHEGRTYYFCSPHCLEKFKADPSAYVPGKEKDCCACGK